MSEVSEYDWLLALSFKELMSYLSLAVLGSEHPASPVGVGLPSTWPPNMEHTGLIASGQPWTHPQSMNFRCPNVRAISSLDCTGKDPASEGPKHYRDNPTPLLSRAPVTPPTTPGRDREAVGHLLLLFGQEDSPFLPGEPGERKSDIKLAVYHSAFTNLRKDGVI